MSEPAPPGTGPGALDWVGLGLLCGSSALAAVLELLFIPLYAGSVIVPVVVVCAVLGNIVLPRLARNLVDSTAASVAPFLVWLGVVLVVGLLPRPEGDVVLPGGGVLQLVSYGVLLGGALAGTVTVVLGTAPRASTPAPVSR